ncbi:Serine/threonine-protein kinase PLK1 [Holothuria leucospilota]|uniref:Serine/threonine-protein kinase PLK1 n=1 Tax=Holothuria leucospilota TaxID=206669 RepID=A0A9Q1CPB9_HOLLE|nr:Serine/threonine-protein kinase PLK1 [Holothuria leucospilota]
MSMEIAIHRSLNHKHIVGFHGFFEDESNIYVLLELCRRRVGCSIQKAGRLQSLCFRHWCLIGLVTVLYSRL